jgi:LuxR family transcriptional regulator, maltose regulon positive regulatory protein
MRSAGRQDAAASRAAGPGAQGVVSRHRLLERLGAAAQVTVVSAPAGSGKTVLLRSWIDAADLAERAAWVSVGSHEADEQRFWLAVLDALRRTAAGSAVVRELSAAPDLDGWAIAERLLKDLVRLEEPVWLVVDDLHELESAEARRQLELLLMRAAPRLRVVLATRGEPQLGLHRLRLSGELTEIRSADLRFSPAEAWELFDAAGMELPGPVLTALLDRTEGWAAGLRLAALSLAGHPDPERFAAEFSGSERTVSEYLLTEVLERQPPQVRRVLLRTSILKRVNGELADLLSGGGGGSGGGGERILQALEEANAFVASADAARSWFRYHQLFADLLQAELRRTAPNETAALHQAAAQWYSDHGFPAEAIRHAQAAQDWKPAARVLADHWPCLHLTGQAGTIHTLLSGFPAEVRVADAELAVLSAADELAHGSLEAAERCLSLAARGSAPAAADRLVPAQVRLSVVRLLLARQRGNPAAVAEEARRLQSLAEDSAAAQPGHGEELRALALINLGISEYWAARFDEAEPHLLAGIAVAQRIGRPFLEMSGQAYQAAIEVRWSSAAAAERGMQAIALAERHGWADESAVGIAYAILATIQIWQGRFEEAKGWIQRAERTVRAEVEPAAALGIGYVRGLLELALGRDRETVTAMRAARRLAEDLAVPHLFVPRMRALLLHALISLGELQRAEKALAEFGERERESGEVRIAVARLRLVQDDPRASIAMLSPVLDGSTAAARPTWLAHALVLKAIAQDALGAPVAAQIALERALDLASSDHVLLVFLLHPAPALLERHARRGTAHGALIAEILGLIAEILGLVAAKSGPDCEGSALPRRARADLPAVSRPLAGPSPWPVEPLSQSEMRVLRYLPTNLSAVEIAGELSLSVSTVRTHIRHLFAKLGAHRRTEAVAQARAVGLLAPSPDIP